MDHVFIRCQQKSNFRCSTFELFSKTHSIFRTKKAQPLELLYCTRGQGSNIPPVFQNDCLGPDFRISSTREDWELITNMVAGAIVRSVDRQGRQVKDTRGLFCVWLVGKRQ